jgi:antitoxin MazE
MMKSSLKLSNWGNSLGLRIPKQIADELNLTDKTSVSISLVDNQILIKKDFRRPKSIKELFESRGYENNSDDQKLFFPSEDLRGREII